MKFAKGNEVVWLHDGQEIPATFLDGPINNGTELYHINAKGQNRHVMVSEILPAKKPGFEIRDLAFVLDEGRDTIEGEIVAIGSGPKKRAFYQLNFEPGIGRAQSWYNEDEVFNVSDPKKKTIPRVSTL